MEVDRRMKLGKGEKREEIEENENTERTEGTEKADSSESGDTDFLEKTVPRKSPNPAIGR